MMIVLKELWKYLKGKWQLLLEKPKTPEEKTLHRMNVFIFLCAVFLIVYGSFWFVQVQHGMVKINTMVHNTSTNTFNVGDAVGIKYFGGVGLIREKTLGIKGYTYTIRQKNDYTGEYDLPFEPWEIYNISKSHTNITSPKNH
jgi:hypothetical protein